MFLSVVFIFIMYILSWRDATVSIIYDTWILTYFFIEFAFKKRPIKLFKVLKNMTLVIIFILFICSIDYYSVSEPVKEIDKTEKPETIVESNSEIPNLPSGKYVRERKYVDGKLVKITYRKIE